MAKAKPTPKLIHKPASFFALPEWLQQRDLQLNQQAIDSLSWLAALTATHGRYFDDDEDEDEVDDYLRGNIAQYTTADGKRTLVFDRIHLRRIWNTLGEEKRPAKEMLKTLHSTLAELPCYEGLRIVSMEDFLRPRVADCVHPAWSRLMGEFLAALQMTGERTTCFTAAGSERIDGVKYYMHWQLLFAFKMFDDDRVERFSKLLEHKKSEDNAVE